MIAGGPNWPRLERCQEDQPGEKYKLNDSAVCTAPCSCLVVLSLLALLLAFAFRKVLFRIVRQHAVAMTIHLNMPRNSQLCFCSIARPSLRLWPLPDGHQSWVFPVFPQPASPETTGRFSFAHIKPSLLGLLGLASHCTSRHP